MHLDEPGPTVALAKLYVAHGQSYRRSKVSKSRDTATGGVAKLQTTVSRSLSVRST